jgi:hypothetical protein
MNKRKRRVIGAWNIVPAFLAKSAPTCRFRVPVSHFFPSLQQIGGAANIHVQSFSLQMVTNAQSSQKRLSNTVTEK